MRGYQLWAYFEESPTLYGIEMAENRRADSIEIAEVDDWRPRRRLIQPAASGNRRPDEFFTDPAEAAKQAALETARNFATPSCRNLEFRLVELGTEGVKLEPEFSYKLFENE